MVTETDDYYEDAHGNTILGDRSKIKFAFSGWNAQIVIKEDAKLSKITIYMHTGSKVNIGENVQLRECEIYCGEKSQISIEKKTQLVECKMHCDKKSQISIEKKTQIVKSKIHCGKKSQISIGKKVQLRAFNLNIKKCARIIVGIRTAIYNANFCLYNNAIINIGKKVKLHYLRADSRIDVGENAKVSIGSKTTIGGNYNFAIDSKTQMVIGKDCMFSYGIYARTDDAHTIFDVITGENINSTDKIMYSRKIEIGNHVWIGMRSTILYNTEIGNGSIVGAASLVKNKFPNNCIIAGTPAKIIATNRCWARKNGVDDILECGEENVALTKL